MIDKKLVESLVQERINEIDNGLYIVDLTISTSNVIHVELDKLKGGVSVDDCVRVSRNVEHNLDREEQDFELHVSSAGLDKPFRHLNQYAKNVGRRIKVVKIDGSKLEGEIVKVMDHQLVLIDKELQKVEGKKRKEQVEVITELPFDAIKEAKIVISFK